MRTGETNGAAANGTAPRRDRLTQPVTIPKFEEQDGALVEVGSVVVGAVDPDLLPRCIWCKTEPVELARIFVALSRGWRTWYCSRPCQVAAVRSRSRNRERVRNAPAETRRAQARPVG